MPHAYITSTTLKGTGALNIDGTAYDTRLRLLIENISTQVDRHTSRIFQPITATRTFNGDDSTLLLVNDLIAVTSLKEDSDQDGTFDTTWDAKDYMLLPHNAEPTEDWGRPYTYLMVNPKSEGTQDIFLDGLKRYQIVGTFGWNRTVKDTGVDTSGSLGSTATTVNVNTAGIEPGMTIFIDSEQIYVESTGAAGTALTVLRGVNGAASGTHATTAGIDYFLYPGPIAEAVMIQSSRLWKRRESGFANQLGYPDTGIMQTWSGGLDPDVKELLTPYRRLH